MPTVAVAVSRIVVVLVWVVLKISGGTVVVVETFVLLMVVCWEIVKVELNVVYGAVTKDVCTIAVLTVTVTFCSVVGWTFSEHAELNILGANVCNGPGVLRGLPTSRIRYGPRFLRLPPLTLVPKRIYSSVSVVVLVIVPVALRLAVEVGVTKIVTLKGGTVLVTTAVVLVYCETMFLVGVVVAIKVDVATISRVTVP